MAPHPYPLPKKPCRKQPKAAYTKRRSGWLGDEPLERKPFVVKLRSSKLMKTLNSLKSPLPSNLKDPHSKGEEPDHLLCRELPINSIATQSLGKSEGEIIANFLFDTIHK